MGNSLNQGLLIAKTFVGGEWVDAGSGLTENVVNPATGERVATVPRSGKAETVRGIDEYVEIKRLSIGGIASAEKIT